MRSSIEGYSFVGKREDFDTSLKIEKIFATVPRIAPNKAGLDTMSYGLYRVTQDATVEALSTDSVINITGHSAKVGDVIRVKTSANSIDELDIVVKSVTANSITLDGVVSAAFATGDTVDILRPIPQRYSSDGASLASVTVPPIQINVKSAGTTTSTTVLDDQDTPANTVPIPVKLYGTSASINITAEDLNVQLSHSAANPDSVQIGDGTEIMLINASGEAQVRDDDANTTLTSLDGKDFSTETTLTAMSAKLPATLGQKTMANSLAVAIASDQSSLNITNISGTVSLPTGASTEAKQDDVITKLTSLDGKDYATQTTLAALNGKFSSLGQKASASSAPVVLSSEQETILSDIKTAVELIDNAVSGSEFQVDLVDLGGAATESSLSSVDGKLPASLGQKNKAGSMSVTIASDQDVGISLLDILTFTQHKFATTSVDSTLFVELIADIGATAAKKVRIFYAGGEPIYLAEGGAGAESNQMIIRPGMDAEIELSLAANARLSMKAVNATTISSGILIINVLG